MVSKKDYTQKAVEAAHSVMIELVQLLGEFREDVVLIGGWVPTLLMPDSEPPHTGSMDVDLALNHKTLADPGYKTIQELLFSKGYKQGKQPFIYKRSFQIDTQIMTVQVDLLSGEYDGTGKAHRHQKVQDVRARKVRGCDLAFELYTERDIKGTLPEGGKDSAKIRIASIISFITMKGFALDGRLKEKDSWDIYFCLKNYPGGLDTLIEMFKPYLEHGLVKEGLQYINEKFETIEHRGPVDVAKFEEPDSDEGQEMIQRDAFEQVNYFLRKLGFRKS